MSAATVISAVAQPFQASFLSFEIGGIVDELNVDLKSAAKSISFQKLCDPLRALKTAASDPSRLQFDSATIGKLAGPYAMARLRNENLNATLDSAVNGRQNVYFSKYANAASVIATTRGYYSRTSPASSPNLLEILDGLAEQQFEALSSAYTEDDRTGVVKTTSSTVQTDSSSGGESIRLSNFTQESQSEHQQANAPMPAIMPDFSFYGNFGQTVTPNRYTRIRPENSVLTAGYNFDYGNEEGFTRGGQEAVNLDYEYRTPYIDAQARHLRAKISLMDQKFASFMSEQNMPHLEQIFANELASIDNSVYQYQVALLRSFLISPIPGTVTGVYKNPGDAVSAGEPVLRVENNDNVNVTVTVVYRDPIALGAAATITSTLYGPTSPEKTLTGSVVAARGIGDRDRWEVVLRMNNLDTAGNQILPVGYRFDREYTDFAIS